MVHKREHWLRRLADAVGSDIADETARERFAADVLRSLATAWPQSQEAARGSNDAAALGDLAADAYRALRALRFAVDVPQRAMAPARAAVPITVLRLDSRARSRAEMAITRRGSLAQRRRDVRVDLLLTLLYLRTLAQSGVKMAGPNKTGRSIDAPLVICTCIARVYHERLSTFPAHTNASTPTPFDRVCNVVEELFREMGRKVHMSRIVRARACDAVGKKGGKPLPRRKKRPAVADPRARRVSPLSKRR